MGLGDELMASGEARIVNERTGLRVQIIDRHGRARMHPLWRHNPRIAQPGESGEFARIVNGPGARPYLVAISPERFEYRLDYRPVPGELYFDDAERSFGARHRAEIIVGPDLKPGASPNKDWGRARWQAFVTLARARGFALTQLCERYSRPLEGTIKVRATGDFRRACAVLANARAYVGHEGGLHHAAAALGIPGVVIFGGYVPVEVTGYALHRNLGVSGAAACGRREPCAHCAAEMARIAPEQVLDALEAALTEEPA